MNYNIKDMAAKQLLVSVVIPAYNERDVIDGLLQSIKKQTYKNHEVIVIDDSSTDDTALISRKYTKNVFTRDHAERSVQRNFGAKKANGNYLLFLDADMELTPNVIKECVQLSTQDKKIGAVAIPEVSVARNFWEKVKAFERSFYNEEGDVATDAERFFLKDAFDKVGGYDETITGPEDWDLPESIAKAGYKRGRVSARILHNERIKSPFAVARKKYYYALKSHRYIKKQKLPTFSAKTIYFLRPVFYKKWYKLVLHPVLTLGMLFMLSLELFFGGFGYFFGKFTNK